MKYYRTKRIIDGFTKTFLEFLVNQDVLEEIEKIDGTPKKKHLTDADFIEDIKKNPAYKALDINAEVGKMRAWITAHPGRQLTRRFMVNWLNKQAGQVLNIPSDGSTWVDRSE